MTSDYGPISQARDRLQVAAEMAPKREGSCFAQVQDVRVVLEEFDRLRAAVEKWEREASTYMALLQKLAEAVPIPGSPSLHTCVDWVIDHIELHRVKST